jgi:hypothetical protein
MAVASVVAKNVILLGQQLRSTLLVRILSFFSFFLFHFFFLFLKRCPNYLYDFPEPVAKSFSHNLLAMALEENPEKHCKKILEAASPNDLDEAFACIRNMRSCLGERFLIFTFFLFF